MVHGSSFFVRGKTIFSMSVGFFSSVSVGSWVVVFASNGYNLEGRNGFVVFC